MTRRLLTLLCGLAFLLPLSAQASIGTGMNESPRNWSFHLGFGEYRMSQIDKEFKNGEKPFKRIFGSGMKFMFQGGFEYFVYKGWGTLGLEGAIGYYKAKGHGLYLDGTKSRDTTIFNMIPLKGSLVYRFDNTWRDWGVPLVPYGKIGLDSYVWWITQRKNNVASYTDAQNGGSSKGRGATFGFHVSYGMMLAMDFIDPKLARDFDADMGVNHTYLYIEGVYARVNNFGAKKSWNLSDHHFMTGILFEF